MRTLPSNTKVSPYFAKNLRMPTLRAEKHSQAKRFSRRVSSSLAVNYCVVGAAGESGEWLLHIILKDVVRSVGPCTSNPSAVKMRQVIV